MDKIKIIYNYLNEIPDPEIPAISIVELGIIRKIEVSGSSVFIELTPTYSGCSAIHMIENEIVDLLNSKGYENVEIKRVYSPAWTTDWLTDECKNKLRKYGIAPPNKADTLEFEFGHLVNCPYCNSSDTILKSWFGSTACKSIYSCNNCQQPFEKFKSI